MGNVHNRALAYFTRCKDDNCRRERQHWLVSNTTTNINSFCPHGNDKACHQCKKQEHGKALDEGGIQFDTSSISTEATMVSHRTSASLLITNDASLPTPPAEVPPPKVVALNGRSFKVTRINHPDSWLAITSGWLTVCSGPHNYGVALHYNPTMVHAKGRFHGSPAVRNPPSPPAGGRTGPYGPAEVVVRYRSDSANKLFCFESGRTTCGQTMWTYFVCQHDDPRDISYTLKNYKWQNANRMHYHQTGYALLPCCDDDPNNGLPCKCVCEHCRATKEGDGWHISYEYDE